MVEEATKRDPLQLARDEFSLALRGKTATALTGQLNSLHGALLSSGMAPQEVYKELIGSASLAITRAKSLRDKETKKSLESVKKGFEQLSEAFKPAKITTKAPTPTEGKQMSGGKI